MASDVQSARDDLAYMRGLVDGTAPMQRTIGECFFWAGLLYGGQCFLHWLQTLEIAPSEGAGALAIAWTPTVLFCGVLTVIIWNDRKTKVTGAAARALGAVFQGAGLADRGGVSRHGQSAAQRQATSAPLRASQPRSCLGTHAG